MSLSRRTCLSDVVVDFDSFIKMFQRSSFYIDKFLLESYLTTEMTEQFGELEWQENKDQVIFSANTSVMSYDEIGRKIKEEQLQS